MAAQLTAVLAWPLRRWLVATVAAIVAALVMGVPTGVVETPFYTRMTPVEWWNYPIWAVSAILIGLTAATFVRVPDGGGGRAGGGVTVSGGLLSTFAIGCPVCNKLVVALLGVGGALDYWAPLQPILGVMAVAALAAACALRLRGERTCAVPSLQAPPG